MDFADVIRARRSIRKYTNEEVPDAALRHILEAARLAPTWAHKQGHRVIVVQDPATRNQLVDAIGQKWTEGISMFIVVCIEPEQSGVSPSKLEYYPVDAAIVMQQIILAATNEGLGTCWIGYFKEEGVKHALGIPQSYRVIGITPVGFPAEVPGPKERKGLSEICFKDTFGISFPPE